MDREKNLIEYYNKFSEEKRLTRRHGRVEYLISMEYIHRYLEKVKVGYGIAPQQVKILDVGAGTGRYSIALADEGYDVTAVELVRYNLGMLKKKNSTVKAYQGNALDLSRFEDESFDLTLVFGPMYHLFAFEDKVRALSEARRVTKTGGYLFVAYCMNEYGVLLYGFRDGHARECFADGRLTKDFQCRPSPEDLYSYVRTEEIALINEAASLQRVQIIAPDGPANYMRRDLRHMDEETFELFVQYQLSVCERPDLMGASAHTVDILVKP